MYRSGVNKTVESRAYSKAEERGGGERRREEDGVSETRCFISRAAEAGGAEVNVDSYT